MYFKENDNLNLFIIHRELIEIGSALLLDFNPEIDKDVSFFIKVNNKKVEFKNITQFVEFIKERARNESETKLGF